MNLSFEEAYYVLYISIDGYIISYSILYMVHRPFPLGSACVKLMHDNTWDLSIDSKCAL